MNKEKPCEFDAHKIFMASRAGACRVSGWLFTVFLRPTHWQVSAPWRPGRVRRFLTEHQARARNYVSSPSACGQQDYSGSSKPDSLSLSRRFFMAFFSERVRFKFPSPTFLRARALLGEISPFFFAASIKASE